MSVITTHNNSKRSTPLPALSSFASTCLSGTKLRGLLAISCLAALTACGGGGGGGGGSASASTVPPPPQLGLVKVTAQDSYGAPLPGVMIQSTSGKISTDAQGTALVPLSSPNATETVSLSLDSFVPTSVPVTSTTGKVNETTVTLERMASPAGGSLASRSGTPPTVDAPGQQMSFEIELIIVDGKSQPIPNLTAANFTLRACTPDATTAGNDCIGGTNSLVPGSGAAVDVAYTPASAQPEALAWIAGATQVPFAVGLLLDQSGSIATTDPTGARIFSTKEFLKGLGPNDRALLAAFAGNPGAVISTAPLTLYAPFRDQAAASTAYFSTLDTLATQVGGNTPLYASIDSLRQQMSDPSAAAAAPAGLAKAIVVFTDGADTYCADAEACRVNRQQTIAGARADGTRLFTIGLSSAVDIAALGELANQTGGAFLYADNTEQLLSLYGSVGALVSLSQPTYRLRWTVTAAAAAAFVSGQSLLGHVQVKVGSSSFDVPFVVGVP